MAKNKIGNFFIVSNSIFKFGFKPSVISVYCCLLKHMGIETRTCYPSRSEISKLCRVSLKTVDKAVRVLCNSGLVKKEAQYWGDGGRVSNLYTITDLTSSGDPCSG
jgi:predicted transcriptional regulator